MNSPVVIPDIDEDTLESCSVATHSAFPQHSTQTDEDSASSDPTWSIRIMRERDGRCANCGLQTHSFRSDPYTGDRVKQPLTIQHEVHRGRCLLCYPLPSQVMQTRRDKIGLTATNAVIDSFSMPQNVVPTPTVSTSVLGTSPTISAVDSVDLKVGESAEILDILHTMTLYPCSEFVQEMGCEALWVQSWDDETSFLIGRLGGIDRILDAMMNFPSNAQIQHGACEALQNLASNRSNRALIVDHGGAALVVQAMMRHLYSPRIQQSGCSTLGTLATSSELREDILQAGGGLACVHSLRKFAHDRFVCFHACQALQTLGFEK